MNKDLYKKVALAVGRTDKYDEATKKEFIDDLVSIWLKYPEFRFGQFLRNVLNQADTYYITDEQILLAAQQFLIKFPPESTTVSFKVGDRVLHASFPFTMEISEVDEENLLARCADYKTWYLFDELQPVNREVSKKEESKSFYDELVSTEFVQDFIKQVHDISASTSIEDVHKLNVEFTKVEVMFMNIRNALNASMIGLEKIKSANTAINTYKPDLAKYINKE